VKKAVLRALPILTWSRGYQRPGLRGDVLSGLVVAALAIPQALGYAAVAGVPSLTP
jgi:MFS superfamily sulfate permease-like transporter